MTNETRTIKAGFSWPIFLFTPFYGIPLFLRGLPWHGLAIALVALSAVAALENPALALVGLLLLASMFYYGRNANELAIARLLSKGCRPELRISNAPALTAISLKPFHAHVQTLGGLRFGKPAIALLTQV